MGVYEDAERVEPNDDQAYYEFLEQPPVEKVQRLYSVDEVKRVGSGQAGRLIIGFSTAAGSVSTASTSSRAWSTT